MNEDNAEVGQAPDPDRYAEFRQYIGAAAKEFKKFNDLTDAEKIERLRRELQSANSAIKSLTYQVHQLLSHQHGDRGELMIPLYGGPIGLGMTVGGGCYPGLQRDPLE